METSDRTRRLAKTPCSRAEGLLGLSAKDRAWLRLSLQWPCSLHSTHTASRERGPQEQHLAAFDTRGLFSFYRVPFASSGVLLKMLVNIFLCKK